MAVEGEMLGRKLRHRELGLRIAEFRRVFEFLPLVGLLGRLPQDEQPRAAPLQRRIHGIRQPRPDAVADDEPVHDDLDGMRPGLVELDRIRADLDDFSVDPGPNEALALDPFEHVPEFPRLRPDKGRENNDLRVRRVGLDLIGNLLGGQLENRLARSRIVRLADRGEKEAQVIVNLRRGGNGRSGIGGGTPLLDGDGGGKSSDKIDLRLLHLVEELPRVGREAFDVFPLPLGVQSIECQGGFARTAQPGDNHQLLPWNLNREIFQVMLACANDFYDLGRHFSRFCETC